MPQAVTVTSPPGVSALVFRTLRAREELGRLFEFELELFSENAAIKLADVVGQNLTITAEFTDERKRYFNGDVVQFRQITQQVDKYFSYFAVLRPRLWFLGLTSDCKIFQNKTAPDIIKAILDEHGITDVTRSLSRTYNPREYCVQYNESDLDFISRLMEEEGIYYYFTHASGKHTLVLSDSLSAHSAIAGTSTVPYMVKKEGYASDIVYDWNLMQQAASGKFAHTDYDFTKPRADLKSQSAISRTHAHAGMERFAFPGIYTETANGTAIARTRVEELQAGWEVMEGRTNAVYFAAGSLFTLKDYARSDQNREHLLTALNYEVKMETSTAAGAGAGQQDSGLGVKFDCSFQAIDSQRPFRAACLTPRPVVQGPQTALVVGKQGVLWSMTGNVYPPGVSGPVVGDGHQASESLASRAEGAVAAAGAVARTRAATSGNTSTETIAAPTSEAARSVPISFWSTPMAVMATTSGRHVEVKSASAARSPRSRSRGARTYTGTPCTSRKSSQTD
jgi:type VI secretion system secreted protein VgrG